MLTLGCISDRLWSSLERAASGRSPSSRPKRSLRNSMLVWSMEAASLHSGSSMERIFLVARRRKDICRCRISSYRSKSNTKCSSRVWKNVKNAIFRYDYLSTSLLRQHGSSLHNNYHNDPRTLKLAVSQDYLALFFSMNGTHLGPWQKAKMVLLKDSLLSRYSNLIFKIWHWAVLVSMCKVKLFW